MRKIKFRLWDKENKKMGYQDSDHKTWYFDDEYDSIHFPLDLVGFMSYKDEDNSVLTQYTGLKDKNGKEIYEGDILSDIEEKPFYMEYSEKKAAFCFVDKFDPYGTAYYTVKDLHYEGLEIIGNIYENPELLEFR